MRTFHVSILVSIAVLGLVGCGGGSGGGAPPPPPPTVTAVDANRLATTGGAPLTITGTGFRDLGATGTNVVSIGGALATTVIDLSDTTITCFAPGAAMGGTVDVVVANSRGVGTLVGGVTYVLPTLYFATARSATTSVPGSFYRFDPVTSAGGLIGPTGDVLTGIAFDPSYTTMYGINTSPFGDQSLFTVDVQTGATAVVGPTGNGPTNNVGDLTFVGSTLVGNDWDGNFCSFDTATGAGTVLGNNGAFQALAIAADASQTLYFIYGSNPQTLYTVDPATGATTAGPVLSGIGADTICAMAFLDGTLYGVTASDQMATPGANLVSIDTTTGAATLVFALPNDIDAIEGNIR
ncbi:MAG: IPT/TIG domain-containing protein [Planctomycetota bacterium]|jgi:hypothetical protein